MTTNDSFQFLSLMDKDSRSLKEEIALMHVRICQLLQALQDEKADDRAIWQEIRTTALCKAKLVNAESKRLQIEREYFTTEQGISMLQRIAESVRRHVDDDDAVAAIARDIYREMGTGAGAAKER